MRHKRKLIAVALLVTASAGLPASVDAARPADGQGEARRFVFVINRHYARPDALSRAQDALALFVEETMTAEDRAMVVEIGHSTRVLHDFSGSKDATIRAIRAVDLARIQSPGHVATQQFYDSLRWLGETLEDTSQRTVVILASNEPNRSRQAKLYMDDAVDALNRANASVYTIDLGLLHSGAPRYGVSGLDEVSTETGGYYFQTQSRVSFVPAMRQIAEMIRERER